jgi:1-acyl-sn-glycerol-3-phosphate acyltransferase
MFITITIIICISVLGIFSLILSAHKTNWGNIWLNFLDGLNRIFCKYYHRLEYQPVALPDKGPALVVANHVSGLDPMLLIAACHRPLRFMIAREEYERFGLTWLFKAVGCIPVDRSGRPEVALRAALRALEAGEVIALFPQGGLTLPGEKRKLKRGGLWLAQHSNCPIFPVFISGISGIGHVIRGVLWRSQAKTTNFPQLNLNDENHLEYLENLLMGKGITQKNR